MLKADRDKMLAALGREPEFRLLMRLLESPAAKLRKAEVACLRRLSEAGIVTLIRPYRRINGGLVCAAIASVLIEVYGDRFGADIAGDISPGDGAPGPGRDEDPGHSDRGMEP